MAPPKGTKATVVETEGIASTDVVSSVVWNDEDLRGISTFDEAIALAVQAHGPIVNASEVMGDGFALLKDKRVLIGVPIVILEWTLRPGDFGEDYVSARVIARNPNGSVSKYVINDGSTGIREQLASVSTHAGRNGGLFVPNGLRVSEYDTDESGKPTTDPALVKGRGATWYLDTSAA